MIVVITEEGLLAAIASLRDVVGDVWGYNSCDSCHKWSLADIGVVSI